MEIKDFKLDYANLKNQSDPQERQHFVSSLFDQLAPRYDRFNRWVSFYRDENWRKNTVRLLGEKAQGVILDLAAGTGDLAHWAHAAGAKQVHVFDISMNMLELAKSKLLKESNHQFYFEKGSAAQLPFRSTSFDGIVSGFAMRNIFHFLDEVLNEIFRVLKPGGRFAILELSRPSHPVLRLGFNLHMRSVMPIIGRLTTGAWLPFHYLYQTTMTFLPPEDFKVYLEKAGFINVRWKSYLLGGIAIHYGNKPV